MKNNNTHTHDQPVSIPVAYPSLSAKDRLDLFNRLNPIRNDIIVKSSVLNERVVELSNLIESYRKGEIDQIQLGISLASVRQLLFDISMDIVNSSNDLNSLSVTIRPKTT